MNTDDTHIRRPWIALCLSFLAMGVGHIYSGRILRGAAIYFVWFLAPVIAFVGALLPPSVYVLVGFLVFPALLIVGVYVFAAADAYYQASRAPQTYTLRDYNRTSLYCLLIVVQIVCPMTFTAGLRSFVMEAFYIPTRDMAPSILPGDRILVNKMATLNRSPSRGDLIVFRNPEPTGGINFIKRVVGVAGDEITIIGDRIEVNGTLLARDPLPSESVFGLDADTNVFYERNAGRQYKVAYSSKDTEPSSPAERQQFNVPRRTVFVLGDNRDLSRDSRLFGCIHVGDVIGYVDYIHTPAASWSRFGAYADYP